MFCDSGNSIKLVPHRELLSGFRRKSRDIRPVTRKWSLPDIPGFQLKINFEVCQNT